MHVAFLGCSNMYISCAALKMSFYIVHTFPTETLTETPPISKGELAKDGSQSTLKNFFATLATTPLHRVSALSPKSKEEKGPSQSQLLTQVHYTSITPFTVHWFSGLHRFASLHSVRAKHGIS